MIAYWSRVVRFAVLGRIPVTPRDVPIWALCVPFRMWNAEKRYAGDTFADSYAAGTGAIGRPVMRVLYLMFLFVWPIAAIGRAILRGRGARRYLRHAFFRPELVLLQPDAEWADRDVDWGRPDYALAMFYAWTWHRTRAAFLKIDGKREFVAVCQRLGLPIPRTMTKDEAKARGGLVVVKDATTDLGYGVEIVDASELDDVEDLDDCVIQERLINHPALLAALPVDAPLSTLRVITVVDPVRGPIVWRTAIRIGRAGSPVDNTQQGGIWAAVDRETGCIQPGVTKKSFGHVENGVPVRHSVHPDTGRSFVGLRVPWFDEGKALALDAHRRLAADAFTLGWDVGLADAGPVLLEVNVWTTGYDYDPPDDAFATACAGILARLPAMEPRG